MNTRQISRSLSILALALVLGACGRNDPEAMIASAKSYLAKNDANAAIVQLKNALQQAPNNGEARLLLARALLDIGDASGAETEVRKAIESKSSGDEAYPLLGRALLQQHQFQKVTELSERKLGDPQAQADLMSSVAFAYVALGNTDEARKAIDAALVATPQYPRAQVAQAQLAVANNKLPAALELLDAALAQTPNDMQALLLKADVEVSQDRTAQAVKTLQQLVALRPDSVQAQFALFTTLVRAGQVEAAATQLDALKKIAPRDTRTLYAEAVVAYSRNNMPAAREAIQQVLSVAPEHLPSLLLSGLVNYQMGNYSAAQEALRTVVAKVPEDRGALRTLVSTYLRTGRTAQAFDVLEPALQRSPNDPVLLQTAAEVYLAANNPTKSAEMYERAMALDKANVAGQVRLAQVRLASGETARAFKDLEAIAEANPALPTADLALISAHLRQGEMAEALAAANVLEKKQPENPLVYNVKGVIFVSMRDFKSARPNFEQALKLDPAFTAASINLAQLDFAEHNVDGARKRYEQLLTKDKGNEQTLLAYAAMLAVTKAPQAEVKSLIERAITANPSSIRPRVALVGYSTQQRDTKAALAAALAARSAFPENPQVLETLGAAQQAAGENNQALETYARVASILPENPAPLMRLAGMQATTKDYDGAIGSLRKAIALQPYLSSAWLALASVYIAAERTNDGIATARKLQKEYPDRSGGFVLEGQMLMSQKKPAEAAVVFRQGLSLEPTPLLTVMTYAALQGAGKPEQAAVLAQAWQKQHPKDIQLHTFQGQQSVVAKDYKTAALHYRAILDQDPNNVTALNNLAWSLNEMGDPKALEYATRAAIISPYAPTVIDTRGWIMVQRGDTKQGIDLLREATELAPEDPEIRLHLAKALLKSGDKAGAKSELEVLALRGNASRARAEAQQLLKDL